MKPEEIAEKASDAWADYDPPMRLLGPAVNGDALAMSAAIKHAFKAGFAAAATLYAAEQGGHG